MWKRQDAMKTFKCQNVEWLPYRELNTGAYEVWGIFKDKDTFFRKMRQKDFDEDLMARAILETDLPAFVFTKRCYKHTETRLYTADKFMAQTIWARYKELVREELSKQQ